jgi:hypothetical protein
MKNKLYSKFKFLYITLTVNITHKTMATMERYVDNDIQNDINQIIADMEPLLEREKNLQQLQNKGPLSFEQKDLTIKEKGALLNYKFAYEHYFKKYNNNPKIEVTDLNDVLTSIKNIRNLLGISGERKRSDSTSLNLMTDEHSINRQDLAEERQRLENIKREDINNNNNYLLTNMSDQEKQNLETFNAIKKKISETRENILNLRKAIYQHKIDNGKTTCTFVNNKWEHDLWDLKEQTTLKQDIQNNINTHKTNWDKIDKECAWPNLDNFLKDKKFIQNQYAQTMAENQQKTIITKLKTHYQQLSESVGSFTRTFDRQLEAYQKRDQIIAKRNQAGQNSTIDYRTIAAGGVIGGGITTITTNYFSNADDKAKAKALNDAVAFNSSQYDIENPADIS